MCLCNQLIQTYVWWNICKVLYFFFYILGNLSKQMIMKSYPHEMQELFGSGETILALNSWVFNEVNETLNIAEFNSSGKQLRESLNQSKVFLFLHLLATDTSGHSDKPQSQWVLSLIFPLLVVLIYSINLFQTEASFAKYLAYNGHNQTKNYFSTRCFQK